jgi:hypothetical protein
MIRDPFDFASLWSPPFSNGVFLIGNESGLPKLFDKISTDELHRLLEILYTGIAADIFTSDQWHVIETKILPPFWAASIPVIEYSGGSV